MQGLRNAPHANSEDEALRLQLEGGLEVLEAAASRYRELSATLLAMGWQWRLRRKPTLVQSTLAQEPSVPEALARLQQRAQREPGGEGPASRFLRQFEAERTKLWHALGRRLFLHDETLSLNAGPLMGRLAQLQSELLPRRPEPEPPPPPPLPPAREVLPPGPGESVLLKGTGWLEPFVAAGVLLSPVVVCTLPLLFQNPEWWWGALALFSLCWASFHVRSGRYWLTPERLVWQPRWGERVEVPLSAIGDGDIAASSWGNVTVKGWGRVRLRYVPHASELATLLTLHRRQEFRGLPAAPDPRCLCVRLGVHTQRPDSRPPAPDPEDTQYTPSEWFAVLRPGFVAFFRHGIEGDLFLDALTEPSEPVLNPAERSPVSRLLAPRSRDRIEVDSHRVDELLWRVPEERLDAMLRKAASSLPRTLFGKPQAFLWEARELTWTRPSESLLALSRGDEVMWADLTGREDTPSVQRLLEQWTAQRQGSSAGGTR